MEDSFKKDGEYAYYDTKSIVKLRNALEMYPLKEGLRKCLKCDGYFKSSDIKGNRICETCKDKEDYTESNGYFGDLY